MPFSKTSNYIFIKRATVIKQHTSNKSYLINKYFNFEFCKDITTGSGCTQVNNRKVNAFFFEIDCRCDDDY